MGSTYLFSHDFFPRFLLLLLLFFVSSTCNFATTVYWYSNIFNITILSWVDSSHIIPIKRHIVQRLVYESSKCLFTLKTSSRAGLSCRTSRFNNCKERGKKNSLMSNCQQSTPDDPRTKNRAPISSICFLFLAPVNLVSGLSRWSHQRSLHCVFQNPVWVHEVHSY